MTDTINQMSDLSGYNSPNFSNVGTHFPLKYSFGPGYPDEDQKIYWETDDSNPNQVNYDLDTNTKTSIEEEISGSIKQNKLKSNIITRNVNRRRGRFIR